MSFVLLGSRRLVARQAFLRPCPPLRGLSTFVPVRQCLSRPRVPMTSLGGGLVIRRNLSSGGGSRPRFEKIIKVTRNQTKADGSPQSWLQRFMTNFLGPKPMPERHTAAWYGEMLLICTVFGITGSSTMLLVRPAVKDVLGIEGSFREGPWSYRICSIVIMSPIYAILLVGVGTIFGRHFYFRRFSIKIISRFGIPPEMLDQNWYKNEKYFRKW